MVIILISVVINIFIVIVFVKFEIEFNGFNKDGLVLLKFFLVEIVEICRFELFVMVILFIRVFVVDLELIVVFFI